MNQRLEHIRSGTETLAQQLNKRSTPAAKWNMLVDQLPSSYTMEEEHRIYRQMFGIDNKKSPMPRDSDDSIELF